MKRARTIGVLVAAVACGGGGEADPEPTTGGPDETSASAAASEADADEGSVDGGPTTGATADPGSTSAGPPADDSSGSEGGAPPPSDPLECDALGDAVVFCSDFEEGDLSVWDDYDGNPPETNALLEDAGPFDLAGNHVGRLRVPEGRGGADFVKELPSSHTRLYARWYIQYEPGFDFTAPNHGGGLHAGARDYLGQSGNRPGGDDWFGSWIEYTTAGPTFSAYTYYRGMYMDCADPNGACWGDSFPCMVDEGEVYCEKPQHRETIVPPTLESGRWYCVEMMLDGGTPSADGSVQDGQLDFWVDGTQIGPWTDLWLRTVPEVQPSLLWLSLFHHDEHSVEGVLYDHVVVSTEPVGCL